MPKESSLRLRLATLVAGTVLPLLLFSAFLIYQNYIGDRQDAQQRVLEVTRSIRLLVDRELQSQIAALRVLALSRPLQSGDFAAFRSQAEKFLSQYPTGTNLLLADRNGRQIVNLLAKPGEALPDRADLESNRRVVSTGEPVVSNLVLGSLAKRPVVAVNVPVLVDGVVAYVLAFIVPFQSYRKIINDVRPNDKWIISIFDGTGSSIARAPNPEEFLGAKASPSLIGPMLAESEAILETTSLEGIPLITAFSRSELSNWHVAAGMPLANIILPLWKTLILTAAVGCLCIFIGLAFAVSLAAQVARAESVQKLVLNEMNHRVRNTLSIVQALAAQTFSKNADYPTARKAFEARLIALGKAHNVLGEKEWASADLRELIEGVLEPYGIVNTPRLQMSGPAVRLSGRDVLMVSLAVHELATNAAKYGALSNDDGKLSIEWMLAEDLRNRRVQLTWKEIDGPPVVVTSRKGFGSSLVEKYFSAQFGGKGTLVLENPGAIATLEFPHA